MSDNTATIAALGGAVVIYRYDPFSNVWETLPRFQGSHVSVGFLCSVNEHIYVFSDSDAPQRYSSVQKDWKSGSELPFLKKKDGEEKLVFVKAVSMKSKIFVIVDDKCCLFQEGGHLGPNLPPPDPVSPHFSPPDSIQRHQYVLHVLGKGSSK